MTSEGDEFEKKEHKEESEFDEIEERVREVTDKALREDLDANEDDEQRVERCVREAIQEIEEKGRERLRLEEETAAEEEEKRERLERSREERLEDADKDKLEDTERAIIENMEEYGFDPEEIAKRWRERFQKDVEEELEKQEDSTEDREVDRDGEEGADTGKTVDTSSYYVDGSGLVYEVKTEGAHEAESSSEVEAEEETQSPEDINPDLEVEDGGEDAQSELREKEEHQDPASSESAVSEEGEAKDPASVESTATDEDVSEKRPESPRENQNESHSESNEVEIEDAPTQEIPDTEPASEETEQSEATETREEESPQEGSESSRLEEQAVSDEATHEREADEERYNFRTSGWPEYYYGESDEEKRAQRLREMFESLTEEEKEEFRRLLREMVKDEEDLERLVKKHGFEGLLEDEEAREEVSKYLKLRERVREELDAGADFDEVLHEICEELELEHDLARSWAEGESMPESLREVLNQEGQWLWSEIVNEIHWGFLPKTKEEFEELIAENEDIQDLLNLDAMCDDVRVWIEIMEMRRRGELDFVIRDGEELYRHDQIWELSQRFGVREKEILSWLRSESIPPLLREQTLYFSELPLTDILPTRVRFERALSRHSHLRFKKNFENKHQGAVKYYESGREKGRSKPWLVKKLEELEWERLYRREFSGPPRIEFESMHDVDRMIEIYSEVKEWKRFGPDYERCELYFKVKDDFSKSNVELARIHGVTKTTISRCKNNVEPRLMAYIRKQEEQRIINNWVQNNTIRLSNKPHIPTPSITPESCKIDVLPAPPFKEDASLEYSQLVAFIEGCCSGIPDASFGVFYVDLRNDCDFSLEEFSAFWNLFEERHPLLSSELHSRLNMPHDEEVRVAIVEGRLYVWKKTAVPYDYLDANVENYFYPADSDGLGRLFLGVRDALDFDEHEGLHRTREHTLSLVKQMTDQYVDSHIRVRFTRLSGYAVRLIVDILNLGHDSLADWITKIEGPNGQGGIENPRFPQGEELEVALSRLISIVISDCHLKDNGSIEYYEPEMERIRIVEKDLQVFGDVILEPSKSSRDNVYLTCLPSVLGKALIRVGLTPGDKTIQNSGLPEYLLDFSYRAKCAFLEELIPQDGSVYRNRISWCHSNAIRIGDKADQYDVESVIGDKLADFIKQHGNSYKKYWRLPIGKLSDLMESDDESISEIACALNESVRNNPNRFVILETKLAKSIGLETTPNPDSIFYHRASQQVTVSWSAYVTGEQAIRMGIVAPPNDAVKRKIMREWLLNNPEDVSRIVRELESSSIAVRRWWLE